MKCHDVLYAKTAATWIEDLKGVVNLLGCSKISFQKQKSSLTRGNRTKKLFVIGAQSEIGTSARLVAMVAKKYLR